MKKTMSEEYFDSLQGSFSSVDSLEDYDKKIEEIVNEYNRKASRGKCLSLIESIFCSYKN